MKFKKKETPIVTTIDVVNELCKIGFSSSSDLFTWEDRDELTATGEIVSRTRAVLKPQRELKPHTLAAIKSIADTPQGLKIEMHNKIPALESLKRYLGSDNPVEIEKAIAIKKAEILNDNGEGTVINMNFTVVNEDVPD